MSFYAYSPLAGGFLAKTANVITEGKEQRWSTETRVGAMYQKLYNRPVLLEALTRWEEIAKSAGTSKAELAIRWVAYNSRLSAKFGDGLILGAKSPEQLDNTLQSLRNGPLEEEIAMQIDALWEAVKDEAPVDNFRMRKES